MTGDFEKRFPLPWKIVRQEMRYEQGCGETFYFISLGDRIIPFAHLDGTKNDDEERSLLSALEYIVECCNQREPTAEQSNL